MTWGEVAVVVVLWIGLTRAASMSGCCGNECFSSELGFRCHCTMSVLQVFFKPSLLSVPIVCRVLGLWKQNSVNRKHHVTALLKL